MVKKKKTNIQKKVHKTQLSKLKTKTKQHEPWVVLGVPEG